MCSFPLLSDEYEFDLCLVRIKTDEDSGEEMGFSHQCVYNIQLLNLLWLAFKHSNRNYISST